MFWEVRQAAGALKRLAQLAAYVVLLQIEWDIRYIGGSTFGELFGTLLALARSAGSDELRPDPKKRIKALSFSKEKAAQALGPAPAGNASAPDLIVLGDVGYGQRWACSQVCAA